MTVSAFIGKLPRAQRDTVNLLRTLIQQAAPGIREAIKWNLPCYQSNGDVCMILPCKSHVNLQLFQGAHLKDAAGILQGAGRGMRHVKCFSAAEIPTPAIKRLVKQAVALNAARQSGNTSSKRRRE